MKVEKIKKQVSKPGLKLKEREKLESQIEKGKQETERSRNLNAKYTRVQQIRSLKVELDALQRTTALTVKDSHLIKGPRILAEFNITTTKMAW
ncbi:hypothetical protein SeLEV6574_g05697 [Synchytrium endobioticum]|nr:hypothetical protein SeLEV6574_g05697 [Synchytrium endobioticum]